MPAQLGEDVRRFLAGQLVAAHRYTRRQRVTRFVRRNRLVLTIVAVAAAVIAVLAWTNVQRILTERAMERDAKLVAQRNADDLVIQSALNYQTSNPTRALAVLRRLQPDSPRLAEARAIAEGAVLRGVAWGIGTDDEELLPAAISPDGKRITFATLSGVLSIYDLDARALVRTKMVSRGARGLWVEGGRRLFVWGGNAPAFLLDPTTNQTTPVPMTGIHQAVTDPSGHHVLCEIEGALQSLDLSTLQLATVWKGAGHIAIADTGDYYATSDGHTITAYDVATSSQLGQLAATDEILMLAASPSGKLAVPGPMTVYELDIASHTWSERSSGIRPENHVFVMAVTYRGPHLEMYTSEGRLAEWHDDHWVDRARTPTVQSLPAVGGSDVSTVAAEGKLFWVTENAAGQIQLPPMSISRVTASRGTSRVAVSGRGLVLVYDLTHVVPARIPEVAPGPLFAVLDDDTVLAMSNADAWSLVRMASGQRVEVPFQWVGVPLLPVQVLGTEKRALVVFNEVRSHLVEVRDDARPLRNLANGPSLPGRPDISLMQAALVPGDATVFSDSESRIYATFGDGHPTELVQLDGAVRGIAPLGRLRFAAVSENGEVVRGSLDGTGTIERGHVPARDDLVVGADIDGHALVASERELFEWDSDLESIAKLDKAIWGMWPARGGAVIELADRSAVLYNPATKESRVLVNRGVARTEVTADGSLFVALTDAGKVVVAELPVGEPFELPGTYAAASIGITPTSRTIVVGSMALDMWHLPSVEGDLSSWIDSQTNAREGGRGIDWPTK